MAIVIESTSVKDIQDQADLVITKPTGLTVGDLMVAVIGARTATISAPVGWTTDKEEIFVDSTTKVFSKVADSSDVAASNFTFTGTLARIGGMIYRLSGAEGTLDAVVGDGASVSTSVSWSGSVTPSTDGCLMIMAHYQYDTNNNNITWSSSTISGTNPTWTLGMEDWHDSGVDYSLAVVSSTLVTTREVTTFSMVASGNADDNSAVLAFYAPSVDDTASNILFNFGGI